MGRLERVLVALSVGALVAGAASGAVTGVDATSVSSVDVTGQAVIQQGVDGLVTVTFSDQSQNLVFAPPAYNGVMLAIGETIAGGSLVGNYVGAGVEGVSFVVECTGPAVPVVAWIKTKSGRYWYNSGARTSPVASVTNRLALGLDSGWTRAEAGSVSLAALWPGELETVTALGFNIGQEGVASQSVLVKDVRLYGEGFMTEVAIVSRVREHFGENVTAVEELSVALQEKDSDADGVTDLEDVIAGREVKFLAEVKRAGAALQRGVLLRWPCVKGHKYTVERADGGGLSDEDDFSPIHTVVAPHSEYLEYEDVGATGVGLYHYRVVKE